MTEIVHISSNATLQKSHSDLDAFQVDLLQGFTSKPKHLNSKYFYDEQGSELFNQITQHPDYYLTACEIEILEQAKSKILHYVEQKPINLIELGPGEGIKTELLIDTFLQKSLEFTYIPIDISCQYLETIVKKLDQHRPAIQLLPLHGDYFNSLNWVCLDSNCRNLVLFLGSSIGNYSLLQAQDFLHHLRENLHIGDLALIGFDLQKDIDVLMRAYDDSAGITREFNLNLLRRINRELIADISIEQFTHCALYNAQLGTMESYLVSQASQVITVQALKQSFDFERGEMLHVENSYKYLLSQIDALAHTAGFDIVENYFDSKGYFVDSLWQAS